MPVVNGTTNRTNGTNGVNGAVGETVGEEEQQKKKKKHASASEKSAGSDTSDSDYDDEEDDAPWWGATVVEYFEEWAGSTNEKRDARKRWVVPVTVLTVVDVACALIVVLAYSMVGYGHDVYRGLSREENWKWSWISATISCGVFGVLWLLDAQEAYTQKHTTVGKLIALTLSTLAGCGLVVAGLLSVKEYSTLPLVFYILLKTGAIRMMKGSIWKRMHIGLYLSFTGMASYITASMALGCWIIWVSVFDKVWQRESFIAYQERLGCNITEAMMNSNSSTYFEIISGSDEVGSCGNVAYVMFGVPLAVFMLNLVYGLACRKLSRRGGATQLVLVLLAISVIGTWTSASLSSVQMGIADDIIQLLILFTALFAFGCMIAVGPRRIYRQVLRLRLTQKVIGYSHTDLVKAILFVVTMTLIPFFLALSAISAAARRAGLSFHRADPDDEKDGFLTASTSAFMKWWFSHPQKIFKYASYVSIGYFCFTIGVGKLAVLFLAWLIGVMRSQHVAVVLIVFFIIGVVMFLLPPIPGPPVYITGGLLIVGALEDASGFWPALVIAIFVNEFTKLFSSMLQQKLIGERLSGNVSIRYQVGMNSLHMRAIRYCLEQKGLTVAKVAILCGGPDWPTSVLCGILRIPLFQCLIGSAPVLVLYLGWTTTAGALLLKIGGSCDGADDGNASDAGIWSTLNSIALAMTFVSMLFTATSALYFMENTIATKREILDAMPIDKEVEELEEDSQARTEAYESVTRWGNLSKPMRAYITISAISGALSCQLGVVLAQRSFESFTVSCPIPLVDVVKPTGWVSIGLIIVSIVSLSRFRSIANRRVEVKLRMIRDAHAGALPVSTHRIAMLRDDEDSASDEML